MLREGRNDPDPPGTPGQSPSADSDTRTKEEILCRQCRQGVTDPEHRISVQGAHQHTFANPQGIVFEIGCFRKVRNCGTLGPPTGEFTWFSGFQWRVLVCGSCMTHLGWMFTTDGPDNFFGLILDRLIFP